MKYYLDCEFDGLDGKLLSMGIVSETGKSLYAVMNILIGNPWVADNVFPLLFHVPIDRIDHMCFGATPEQLSALLESYFKNDLWVHVIADWPDDLKYLNQALITGPGTMIDIPGIKMSVRRVDAYPTTLKGAVQHNAWWDAMALWTLLAAESKTGA